MKRAKKILAGLGVLVLMGVFVSSLSFAQVKTIRFMTDEADPPSVEVFKQIISEFERINPSIRVQLEVVSTVAKEVKVAASIATGVAIDVLHPSPEMGAKMAMEGRLLSLDDVVTEIGEDDFLPQTRYITKGHTYLLPWNLGASVWFIRTDLFAEKGLTAPDTWKELLQCAEALTEDLDGDGMIDRYGVSVPAGPDVTGFYFAEKIWQAGWDIMDEDLNVILDNPRSVEALEFTVALSRYAPPGILSYSWYEVIDGFVSKRAAMCWYLGRVFSHVYMHAPDIKDVVECIPLPKGRMRASYYDPSVVCAMNTTKYPEATKKFLKFLITGEPCARFLLTVPGHILPALKSVQKLWLAADNEIIRDHPESMKVLAEATSYGTSFSLNAGGIDPVNLRTRWTGKINPYGPLYRGNEVGTRIIQKVLIEGATPEEAIKWGAEELNRLIEEAKAME